MLCNVHTYQRITHHVYGVIPLFLWHRISGRRETHTPNSKPNDLNALLLFWLYRNRSFAYTAIRIYNKKNFRARLYYEVQHSNLVFSHSALVLFATRVREIQYELNFCIYSFTIIVFRSNTQYLILIALTFS